MDRDQASVVSHEGDKRLRAEKNPVVLKSPAEANSFFKSFAVAVATRSRPLSGFDFLVGGSTSSWGRSLRRHVH